MKRTAKRSIGFTLVEILLTMLIISIMVLGLNAAFRQANFIGAQAESQRPFYHRGRVLTELLQMELSGVYFPQLPNGQGRPFNFEPTKLGFYTLTPSWEGGLDYAWPAKVRYEFAQNQNSQAISLLRSAQICSGETLIGTDCTTVLEQEFSELSWQAYDRSDQKWKDNYTSTDAPPEAIKIAFGWPADKNRPPIHLETILPLSCQKVLTGQN